MDFIHSVPVFSQGLEPDEPVSITMKKKLRARKKALELVSELVNEGKVVEDGDEMEEEEAEIITEIVSEKAIPTKGLGATLNYLKSRGGKDSFDDLTVRARVTDKVFAPRDHGDDVVLEYRDKDGKLMSTKEAFRYLSYSFHGKAPGKKKVEIRIRREQEELKKKKSSGEDFVPPSLEVLGRRQKETGVPFLITDGNAHKILENQKVNLEKPDKKKKK
eukprot:TRINITY_DN3057_c0_g1_i2.p1 TRINITY_DN3057_c0_g1~~TRINITY_DN3057_c0_g1_i2.p1  ORF type:complete len:218 (+),score=70.98 TRINITY_DN3057_c0_g1_i2:795-1448(+)